VVAQGCLEETPYPGTTALYWTTIELTAPAREGMRTWSVEFEPREPDLPHERGSTTFSFLVVRPPEHRLTIKVIEKDTSGDGTDHAARLVVWGSLRTRLEKNMLIEVEVLSVPEEDPDAAWLM
jgi:hypothetical protein